MSAYRCIAKLKRNDVQAFNLLDAPLRLGIAPVFELVRMSDDNESPEKEREAAQKLLVNGLRAFRTFRGKSTATVDLDRFPPGLRMHGRHPAQWGYMEIASYGQRVIPVVSDHAEPDAQAVIFDAARLHDRGLCVRLDGNDLVVNAYRVVRNLNALVRASALPPSDVDLLIDFGSLGRYPRDQTILGVARAVVLMDGYGLGFRSATLAGASTVKFVNEAVPEEHDSALVVREELAIWTRVSRILGWQRGIQFADYGIVHPLHAGIPNEYANGKVRYTAGSGTLYLRGCNKKKEALIDQYPALVRRLVERAEYRGMSFSAADRFFGQVAAGEANTGDTGRWICYDMNHHMTYVARQVMAILALPEAARASEERVDAIIDAF